MTDSDHELPVAGAATQEMPSNAASGQDVPVKKGMGAQLVWMLPIVILLGVGAWYASTLSTAQPASAAVMDVDSTVNPQAETQQSLTQQQQRAAQAVILQNNVTAPQTTSVSTPSQDDPFVNVLPEDPLFESTTESASRSQVAAEPMGTNGSSQMENANLYGTEVALSTDNANLSDYDAPFPQVNTSREGGNNAPLTAGEFLIYKAQLERRMEQHLAQVQSYVDDSHKQIYNELDALKTGNNGESHVSAQDIADIKSRVVVVNSVAKRALNLSQKNADAVASNTERVDEIASQMTRIASSGNAVADEPVERPVPPFKLYSVENWGGDDIAVIMPDDQALDMFTAHEGEVHIGWRFERIDHAKIKVDLVHIATDVRYVLGEFIQ